MYSSLADKKGLLSIQEVWGFAAIFRGMPLGFFTSPD
jgi:hypothetical protein